MADFKELYYIFRSFCNFCWEVNEKYMRLRIFFTITNFWKQKSAKQKAAIVIRKNYAIHEKILGINIQKYQQYNVS